LFKGSSVFSGRGASDKGVIVRGGNVKSPILSEKGVLEFELDGATCWQLGDFTAFQVAQDRVNWPDSGANQAAQAGRN
jgi:hypothetical protein